MSEHPAGPRPVHLLSLHAHHRWLLVYGLIQAGVALLVTGLTWLPLGSTALSLPGGAVISHSPLLLLLDALLITVALTYALAAAIRAVFWLRLLIAAAVACLLLFLGWGVGATALVLLPALAAAGYVLWRGAGPAEHHPSWTDLLLLGGAVALVWALALFFGVRPPGLGPMGTLHLGLAEIVSLAAFLPVPLLLLSGLDLAELGANVTGRLGRIVGGLGDRPALVSLLLLSAAKLAFFAWSGDLHPHIGWAATLLFLIPLYWLARHAPAHLLHAEPRFIHWLGLALLALLAVVIAAVTLVATRGGAAAALAIGPVTLALIGPVWLLSGAALALLRPGARPLALFIALLGLWVTLSLGLEPLTGTLLGHPWPGIAARDLGLTAALLFGLWSLWLLLRRRTSPLAPLALAVSLFLDWGYLLDQLLARQVAAAELYSILQAALYLGVLHLTARPGRVWARSLPWLLVAGVFTLSRLQGAWVDPIAHLLAAAVLAAALVWDLLMCEHRMGGPHAAGPLARPGRLFLYLGYATWVAAQMLFANTGQGTEVLALEPLLALGFVALGLPRVFYHFLSQGRRWLHNPAA